MLITDQRTLQFLETLKTLGKVRFDAEFCAALGMQKQNLVKIKKSELNNHFTAAQLRAVGEIYGADMNYIYGFTNVPFRAILQTESKQ